MIGLRFAVRILLTASDVANRAVDLARSIAHGDVALLAERD